MSMPGAPRYTYICLLRLYNVHMCIYIHRFTYMYGAYMYIYVFVMQPAENLYTCRIMTWVPCRLQEPCREIINFAKAEWRDVRESGASSGLCPVLTALRNANPKKSESKLIKCIYFF